MNEIIIYTTRFCPYCLRAKEFLKSQSLVYKEVAVDGDSVQRAELRKKAGGSHTVPQIWINGHHVGGCDDLLYLNASGQLSKLLK